ncbi:hypothetical protein BaRGS_00017768 [Batillaria attramentaria]|uniref:Uncharacterized protein n=1 Tax=Batillaria attramentaria TaxID=370345 RepID=A0ABD0KV57_9CAEN
MRRTIISDSPQQQSDRQSIRHTNHLTDSPSDIQTSRQTVNKTHENSPDTHQTDNPPDTHQTDNPPDNPSNNFVSTHKSSPIRARNCW